MTRDMILRLISDDELLYYLRHRPHWIKHLTRYPGDESQFMNEYRVVTKKTFGDKIQQVGQYASLANMFLVQ